MKIYRKPLALIASVLLLASCSSKEETAQTATPVVEELPKIDIKQVYSQNVTQVNEYTATVEADNINNISPATANRIKSIHADVGDHVRKGQTLVVLDKANAEQLKVSLDHAKIEYDRAKSLLEIGSGTQQAVDQCKSNLDALESKYKNMMENTILTSPISGVVTARNYDPGDMTGATPILTIGQISPSVNVVIYVTENDYAKIRKGMNVDVKFDVYPDETFSGTVKRIHPTVDSRTRTFAAEISVSNKNQKIKPGMFARVQINLGTANHVVVPDRAIVKQTGSGNKYVYIYHNGTVSYNKVELGQRIDDSYEVISGVLDGDYVVISGQAKLIDGAKVEILKRDANGNVEKPDTTKSAKQ